MAINAYGYIPNLGANMFGAVYFGLILIVHFILGIATKEWWIMGTWCITAAMELTGYICRLLQTYCDGDCQAGFEGFKGQMCCLVFAPVFMSAGIYYQLGVEVTIYGEKYSVFKPMIYTAIFTTLDIISCFIQAAGGGIAAGQSGNGGGDVGLWVMVGGLVFQVVTLFFFLGIFILVNYRIFKKGESVNWNPQFEKNRQRPLFKYWLPAVLCSLLLLIARSIYRVIELCGGWDSKLQKQEPYFLVLDGLMIVLGLLCLTVIHPGVAYGYVPVRGLHYKAKSGDMERLVDDDEDSLDNNSFAKGFQYRSDLNEYSKF